MFFIGSYPEILLYSGKAEAAAAGEALKKDGYEFDLAYTSYLKRATETLGAIKKVLDKPNLETKHSWRLNERHYGGLTGLNKAETAKKYGDEQVRFDYQPNAIFVNINK